MCTYIAQKSKGNFHILKQHTDFCVSVRYYHFQSTCADYKIICWGFFQVVLALLSKNEKEEVQQLFDLLSESQSDQYSLEELESLKKVYEL